jgi:hypothetical protein
MSWSCSCGEGGGGGGGRSSGESNATTGGGAGRERVREREREREREAERERESARTTHLLYGFGLRLIPLRERCRKEVRVVDDLQLALEPVSAALRRVGAYDGGLQLE